MYLNKGRFKDKMDKRGILDLLYFTIIIAGLAIFILICGFVVSRITTELRSSPINESSLAVGALDYSDQIVNKFDYVFLIIFFGLIIGMLISAALIDVGKIFFPIFLILFGIDLLIGVIMNNVYDAFQNNATLAGTAVKNVFVNAIINHYILVLIGVGVLSMILYFAKPSGGRGERL